MNESQADPLTMHRLKMGTDCKQPGWHTKVPGPNLLKFLHHLLRAALIHFSCMVFKEEKIFSQHQGWARKKNLYLVFYDFLDFASLWVLSLLCVMPWVLLVGRSLVASFKINTFIMTGFVVNQRPGLICIRWALAYKSVYQNKGQTRHDSILISATRIPPCL